MGGVVVLALSVALVAVDFLAPIVPYIAAPHRRAKALLGAALRWLEGHNRDVMITVFGTFGMLPVAKGAMGLL